MDFVRLTSQAMVESSDSGSPRRDFCVLLTPLAALLYQVPWALRLTGASCLLSGVQTFLPFCRL